MNSHNRTAPLAGEGKIEDDEDDLSVLRRIVAPGYRNLLNAFLGDYSKVPSQKMMERLDKLEDFSENRHYGTIFGTNFLVEEAYKTTRQEVFFTKVISDDVKDLVEKAAVIETNGLQAAEEEQEDEHDEQEAEGDEDWSLFVTKFISDDVKELVEKAMSIETEEIQAFGAAQEDEHDEKESKKREDWSILLTTCISDDVQALIEKAIAIETKELPAAEEEQKDEYDEESSYSSEEEEEEEKNNESSPTNAHESVNDIGIPKEIILPKKEVIFEQQLLVAFEYDVI